jgi:transcriptional regulator with XRE-family HTH domain
MTDEVKVRLSEILKQAQGDRPMRKFAKELGVSHVTLMSWVNCEGFPSRESLEKIAVVLLSLTNNLSDSEAFRLATLLLERVNKAIAAKL